MYLYGELSRDCSGNLWVVVMSRVGSSFWIGFWLVVHSCAANQEPACLLTQLLTMTTTQNFHPSSSSFLLLLLRSPDSFLQKKSKIPCWFIESYPQKILSFFLIFNLSKEGKMNTMPFQEFWIYHFFWLCACIIPSENFPMENKKNKIFEYLLLQKQLCLKQKIFVFCSPVRLARLGV